MFDDLLMRQARERLRALEESMSRSHEQNAETLETYGKLQQTFEYMGGYTFESRIHQMLSGLGFSTQEEDRRCTNFLVASVPGLIGKNVAEAPDLLLLDEPTNHLDIAAVEWLKFF